MTPELADLDWVRLSFVDVFGATHSIQLPAGRFDDAVQQGAAFDGSALEGRARHLEEDMLLRPDPTTLLAMGNRVGRATCTVWTPSGPRWPGDPRTALSLVCDDLEELCASWAASAEVEFYLMHEPGRPVDRGTYFAELEGPAMAIARGAANRLIGYGVPIGSCHHEAGPGQYEIDLGALPPLQLADALVLTRLIVQEEATARGLYATFMPRPLDGEPGSGLHISQQLEPLLDGGDLTDDGRHFLAGQLAHAAGLCALAAPTINSYKRLHSGPEAPSAAVWAHVNRGALYRIGAEGLEFRGADPLANPYLLVAGLLVAGAHGLEAELELPPPEEEDFYGWDAGVDKARFLPLPHGLEQALDALLADDVLVDAFDQALLSRLVQGRRAEIADYRTRVTPWELDRYFSEG